MAWLRSAQAEVKRDMEMARDEVRVMTVHGAKGLEAPIVILADTTTPPQGFHPPRLLQLPAGGAAPPLVWAVAKANDVGPMAAAREAALNEARDEYRRLLYVAMTRAIERLIVCGVDGVNKRPEGCWYDLARGALEGQCVAEPADDGSGDVLRYRKVPYAAAADTAATETAGDAIALPGWLKEKFAAPLRLRASIKPSGFVDDPTTAGVLRPREARRRAILRGNIVHRLMQSLPDIPPDRRTAAAHQYITRQKTDFTESECDTIVEQTLAVLAIRALPCCLCPSR